MSLMTGNVTQFRRWTTQRIQGASAKPSGHWDTGREFCAPDPIFKLVVVLSSYGYILSYWGACVLGLRAVKVFARHLGRWELVFYFWLLERSCSEVTETGEFGLGKFVRRVLVPSNSLSPSTRGWGPINVIHLRSM